MVAGHIPSEVLAALPNPVFVKDSELRYVWVNPAFCEFFGRTDGDMIGCTDAEVFGDRGAPGSELDERRVLTSGEPQRTVGSLAGPDGAVRTITTGVSLINLAEHGPALVGIVHDVTDISRGSRDLDALTGCLNRRGLRGWTEDLEDAPDALVLIDIDHFKRLNDQWGLETGDAALRHLVDTVQAMIRSEDAIARLGGEEFLVVLQSCTAEQAEAIGERIRVAIETTPLVFGDRRVPMTASLGLVHGLRGHECVNDALHHADRLLYRAKGLGRNTLFSAGYDEATSARANSQPRFSAVCA